MSALVKCSNLTLVKTLPATQISVRYLKKKTWDDPYSYKYDRWGKVKKLEPPGGAKHIPFDKRFPISPKDVATTKLGGHIKMCSIIGRDKTRFPHPPGYFDEKDRFHLVKEMIPEFVVPDLTDFKLKPYVSYSVSDINQSPFTAEKLFYATYANKIGDLYMGGQIKDVEKFRKNFIEDKSTTEQLDSKIKRLAVNS